MRFPGGGPPGPPRVASEWGGAAAWDMRVSEADTTSSSTSCVLVLVVFV